MENQNNFMNNDYTFEDLENNKFIVEFLGCETTVTWEHKNTGYKSYNVVSPLVKVWRERFLNTGGSGQYMMLQNTRFHNDYNWLELVIDRVVQLGFSVNIFTDLGQKDSFTEIRVFNSRIMPPEYKSWKIQMEGQSKINLIYLELVEFIKWYNKQN